MATIVKRGDKWQAKIRRDGYPQKSKTFIKYSDAEAWARTQESEMDRGVWRDRTSAEQTTFYKLLERYKKDVSTTKRGYVTESFHIGTMMEDEISKLKLSALTPVILADWRDRRLEVCAGSTVNRELNTISAIINWARKELMIQMENPVGLIRRPDKGQARDRRFEDDEEHRLLTALEDHPKSGEKKYRTGTRNPWIKPLVLMAIETAMRRGELLALHWKNIDFKKHTAFLQITKNGESRTVPLSSRAIAILDGLPRSINGIVFPVSPDAIKKAWERACEGAGIENFHFHDLRHEATSRLAEKLPNLIELAAVTGHKDLQMLKRYYHPRAEDLAKKLG